MAKMAIFGQKAQFWAFWAKKPDFGLFGGFGPFSGPLGDPRDPVPRGFYINPSRRGPAVPAGGPRGRQPRPGAGYPPEEGQGVSPWAGA